MIRNILLSLLIFIAATSVAHAAEQTFNDRKANLTEVSAIRVGYGSGTVRLVVDVTKKVDFAESYAENPSRVIIDLKDAWLSPTVAKEIELKSLAAKKVRVGQFNPSTVRIVIESMADIKPFHLPGGPKGHRFVIDIGNVEFKENPDLNKSDADILKERQERELKERQERELRERQELELKEQRERELKEQQERELREKVERELREKQERELREKIEREVREKLEREMKEQREREKQLEKERKEKLEREMKEQREREKQLEKERKEREKQERREKKEREKKEREAKDKDKDKKSDDENKKEVDQPFTELDEDLGDITALKGKKIVIDPGHGGNDAGAIGPTGVMEKTVTLNVSLELKKLLEAEGATVIMTRETDCTVSSKGAAASDIEELGARCDVANRIQADIFISIHADSFTRPEARGTTGYYYSRGSGAGQRLADCIRRNLVEQLGTPSRGTQPCNFYVVKNTDMPATLIELGFISNKDEEKLLNSREGVLKAAQGILDGIEDYFG